MSFSDTAYVRIFVSDVNDNAPAFPQSVYEVSMDEDREVGSPVVTATADDEDEGEWPLHVLLSPVHVNVHLCEGLHPTWPNSTLHSGDKSTFQTFGKVGREVLGACECFL